MKNITTSKDRYDYFLCRMQLFLKNKLPQIETIHYWTGRNQKKHHIHLSNKKESLTINLYSGKTFSVPDDTVLKNQKRWSITLPNEYDANTFIYETIFRQDGKRPAKPIRTLIGVSPGKERSMRNEYRKQVKILTLSLTRDVQNGEMPYHTAAIHFSIKTGLCEKASLRYFSRFHVG